MSGFGHQLLPLYETNFENADLNIHQVRFYNTTILRNKQRYDAGMFAVSKILVASCWSGIDVPKWKEWIQYFQIIATLFTLHLMSMWEWNNQIIQAETIIYQQAWNHVFTKNICLYI